MAGELCRVVILIKNRFADVTASPSATFAECLRSRHCARIMRETHMELTRGYAYGLLRFPRDYKGEQNSDAALSLASKGNMSEVDVSSPIGPHRGEVLVLSFIDDTNVPDPLSNDKPDVKEFIAGS